MTDWQPISTAPKDGTPVLVSGGYDDTFNCLGLDSQEKRNLCTPCRAWCSDPDGEYWIITLCEGGNIAVIRVNPTDWMPLPLPEPPEDAK